LVQRRIGTLKRIELTDAEREMARGVHWVSAVKSVRERTGEPLKVAVDAVKAFQNGIVP
jgi:hypothetical protein